MAYNGYLIKINGSSGDYELGVTKKDSKGRITFDTKKFIKADSYSVTLSGQDLDSYRDADGLLHRNALAHTCIKVEFETAPMLTNKEVAELMSNIRSRMSDQVEKKVSVTAYLPETDSYVTADCYIPDIQFPIYGTYGNVIHYDAIRLAFIQY